MKKLSILLIIVLLLGSVACKPTPKKSIVQSKADGKLEKAIAAKPLPKAKYTAPQSWEEEIKGKNTNYTARINAKITIPDSDTYPVYRVKPEEFNQAKVDKYINYFLKDTPLYERTDPRQLTKPMIMELIRSTQEKLDIFQDPKNELHDTEVKAYGGEENVKNTVIPELEKKLLSYQKAYQSAPAELELKPAITDFSKIEAREDGCKMLQCYTKDKNIYFRAQDNVLLDSAAQSLGIRYRNIGGEFTNDQHMEKGEAKDIMGAKYTYKQALELSKSLCDDIGRKGYEVVMSYTTHVDAKPVELDFEEFNRFSGVYDFYTFYMTPTLPNNPRLNMLYTPLATDGRMAMSVPWDPHSIRVTVNANEGVAFYVETSSIQFEEQLNSNVALLSFEEIQDIARRYLVLSPILVQDDIPKEVIQTYINVNEIVLGYIKISEKNNLKSGLCLPVWMFYGSQSDKYESQEASGGYILDENMEVTHPHSLRRPMLCINAIDGSIIDLSLGY